MSEPAPEFPGLTAYLEKLLGQQAEAKLAIDGMSQVVAQLDEHLRAQVARIDANLTAVLGVIEEARPLLESGPAKFLASRRQLRRPPTTQAGG